LRRALNLANGGTGAACPLAEKAGMMRLQIDIPLRHDASIDERTTTDDYLQCLFHVPTKRVIKLRRFSEMRGQPGIAYPCIRLVIDGAGPLTQEQHLALAHGRYEIALLFDVAAEDVPQD
jgi:hypothetical protein